MRVLVVEDKDLHCKSAQVTLAEHEVKVVQTFQKAMEIMHEEVDEENALRLLAEQGLKAEPDRSNREAWSTYYNAREKARAESIVPLAFDVVLTDMMMPVREGDGAFGKRFAPNEQAPYGFVIALRAALRGVRFVALVTDTNHHLGAMSAALDFLGDHCYGDEFKPNFEINGARVMFVHAPFYPEVLGKGRCEQCGGSGLCPLCGGTKQRNDKHVQGPCNGCESTDGKCSLCVGAGRVDIVCNDRKDWGKVLADLTA